MLSKSKITHIRSLSDKNTRHQEGIFLVEGRKCMTEFMDSDFEIVEGFFTEAFAQQREYSFPHHIITQIELDRITTLSANRDGVLIVSMKKQEMRSVSRQLWQKKQELIVILDHINDPGNLGTIIRTADWYGISQIICSTDTVDCYNPKVLMATMGSFTRVSVFYTDLEEYLKWINNWKLTIENYPVYWAYLDGESTHTKEWWNGWGYLVIGSEAHGIRPNLEKYITDRITIPRFWLAESLNAGVATAVILDRMRE
jgi:RNA methyltransferase, TrmH family